MWAYQLDRILACAVLFPSVHAFINGRYLSAPYMHHPHTRPFEKHIAIPPSSLDRQTRKRSQKQCPGPYGGKQYIVLSSGATVGRHAPQFSSKSSHGPSSTCMPSLVPTSLRNALRRMTNCAPTPWLSRRGWSGRRRPPTTPWPSWRSAWTTWTSPRAAAYWTRCSTCRGTSTASRTARYPPMPATRKLLIHGHSCKQREMETAAFCSKLVAGRRSPCECNDTAE